MKKFCMLLALILTLSCAFGVAFAGQTVGVIQFAPHPSLDDCYKGFEEVVGGMDGVTIDFQNSSADMSTGDLQAKTMVSQGCSMLVGIATPSAMS